LSDFKIQRSRIGSPEDEAEGIINAKSTYGFHWSITVTAV